MAATPFAGHIPICCLPISCPRLDNSTVLKTGVRFRPETTPSVRASPVRASSKPQREGADFAADEKSPFVSQEDLRYLAKLGAGSVAGAAAIKYGSIILPEITRPNIAQALFMIFAPVVVAVLLLIRQSRNEA